MEGEIPKSLIPRKQQQYKIDLLGNELARMPAARFFWRNQLNMDTPRKTLKQYYSLLGRLILLFTTPHYYYDKKNTPIYPFKECSFLKKFEKFVALNEDWVVKALYKIFAFQDGIHVAENEIYIITEGDNSFYSDDSEDNFYRYLNDWHDRGKYSTILIPITLYENKHNRISHAALLSIYRCNECNDENVMSSESEWSEDDCQDTICFMLLDPHGSNSDEYNQTKAFIGKTIKNHFKRKVTVQSVSDSCPSLQLPEQGGNCVMWKTMLFSLFMLEPTLFDDAAEVGFLLDDLGKFPTENITLFTLALFLRTLPHGSSDHLKTIAYQNFYEAKETRRWHHNVQEECLRDDFKYKANVFPRWEKVNCSNWDKTLRSVQNLYENPTDAASAVHTSSDACVYPCKRCGNWCVHENFVEYHDEKYIPLGMKEIARKMIKAYLYLRMYVLKNITTKNLRFYNTQAKKQLKALPKPTPKVFHELLNDDERTLYIGRGLLRK